METMQLKLNTDTGYISNSVPTNRILEIELKAPESSGSHDAAPLNLALVIDRSGSMAGGKLEQAKAAVSQILDMMRSKDSVSIVDYDSNVRLTTESGSVTDAARMSLKSALFALQTGGTTNLGGGWLMGCEQVALRQAAGKVNRTLLLTDGLANEGITSPVELARHASALFERGVATSTFGIGEDFDEHLLEAMANRGGGNFYYIANTGMIPTLLMEEFRDLAAVTLMDVRIELTFPAGVAHELFGEWRAESQGDKLVIFLSDLPASRTINLFLRITTPAGNDKLVITARATGLNEADQAVEVTNEVALVYAPQETVNLAEQKKDAELVKRFASVAIGHLSDEALRLEKAGRREEAGKMMDRAMAEFGGDLPNPIKLRYDNRSMELRQGLDESTRKNYNSEAYQFKRRRHADQVNGTDD
mgnify:FL=1